MREASEIIHEVESTEDKKKLERLLTEINTRLNNKVDVDLLLCRAGILTKFQQYGRYWKSILIRSMLPPR